jgi:hypothetical protein
VDFSSWLFLYTQLYVMERLYSGRGAEQCTSLDLLTELIDCVLPCAVSLYGSVLGLCLLVGCSIVYIRSNVSISKQRGGEVI